MKRTHIIFIVILAIGLGVILTATLSAGTTSVFGKAFSHPEEKYTISGQLDASQPIEYNPELNPNLTTFYLIDKDGKRGKVYLNQTKPTDFERAESVVVTGKAKDSAFYATDILLKCPSKYKSKSEG